VPASSLISASGGLLWHAKAILRYRSLWSDFTNRIERFLLDWKADMALGPGPQPKGLLLLGPSGGWCLPTQGFIETFPSLIAVDPDPAARAIFLKRFRPQMDPTAGKPHAQEQTWVPSHFERVLPALLTRHPHHAVLFCNVLGQLRYQNDKTIERIEFELGQIKLMLEGRHWASFHDRISGNAQITAQQELEFFSPSPVETQALAKRVAKGGEWLDHLTSEVLPAQAGRRFLAWPISRDRLHWIEAGWIGATRGQRAN